MLKKIMLCIGVYIICLLFFYLYHINQINFLQRDINILKDEINYLENEDKKYTTLCLQQRDPQKLLEIAKINDLELLNKKNCIAA